LLAVMTVVLFALLANAPPGDNRIATLSLWTGFLAPLVAVAGLVLAKRGGKPAPRLARVALAFGIGAFAWPLLLFAPLLLCLGRCY
jgi:hypothetical protein